MRSSGDHIQEMMRRKRSLEVVHRQLALAVDEYYRAVERVHRLNGLSYAQLSGLIGVTRSRVQQMCEAVRAVES